MPYIKQKELHTYIKSVQSFNENIIKHPYHIIIIIPDAYTYIDQLLETLNTTLTKTNQNKSSESVYGIWGLQQHPLSFTFIDYEIAKCIPELSREALRTEKHGPRFVFFVRGSKYQFDDKNSEGLTLDDVIGVYNGFFSDHIHQSVNKNKSKGKSGCGEVSTYKVSGNLDRVELKLKEACKGMCDEDVTFLLSDLKSGKQLDDSDGMKWLDCLKRVWRVICESGEEAFALFDVVRLDVLEDSRREILIGKRGYYFLWKDYYRVLGRSVWVFK